MRENLFARRLRLLMIAAAVGLSSVGTTYAGVFTDVNFSNDSDSGIASGGVYTHAININVDDNVTVNGTVFTGTMSNVAAPATNTYSVAGPTNPFGNNPNNNVTGNSRLLTNDFVYNGNPATVTLNNLIVGQHYTTAFYGAGFGDPGGRVVNVATSDGGAVTYDQNKAGNGNGNRLQYEFTATGTTQAFTFTPANPGNTFHLYALSNRLHGYQSLLTDNFYLGTANGDPGGPALLNSNLAARQGGTLAAGGATPITYNSGGNVQVGNGATGPVDRGNYLLTAFGGAASPNHNFNGSEPGVTPNGQMIVSFDMAPNLAGATADNWGAVNLGLAQANQTVFVNDGHSHFGILFRGNGQIQVFDGGSEITGSGTGLGGLGSGSANWTSLTGVTNDLHHFDLIASDPALHTIDVYADGSFVTEFSKASGFSDGGNNYIGLHGSSVAGFDNLSVAQVPEPVSMSLGLGVCALLLRRKSRR